jgi:hypothetical protein
LLFLAPMLWEKVLPTFSKSSQKFWHLHVYIFVSKHLNEVWRYNEGHAKDEGIQIYLGKSLFSKIIKLI